MEQLEEYFLYECLTILQSISMIISQQQYEIYRSEILQTNIAILCAIEFLNFINYIFICFNLKTRSKPYTIEKLKQKFNKMRNDYCTLLRIDNKMMEGFFKGSEKENIYKENVKEFISIQFFDRQLIDINDSSVIELINSFQSDIELIKNYQFKEGQNKNVSLQDNLNDQRMPMYKSIFIHQIIEYCNQKYIQQLNSKENISYNNLNQFEQIKINASIENQNKKPIIFFHGLGIGPIQQIDMINHFIESKREVQIILLNWVTIRAHNRAIPTALEFAFNFELFTRTHELQDRDPVYVTHSYGSHMLTWLMTYFKVSKIQNAVMIEPTSLLLNYPTALAQVIQCESKYLITFILRMLVCRDSSLVELFFRKFKQQDNIMTQEMMPLRTKIHLSAEDEIICAKVAEEQLKVESERLQMCKVEYEVENGLHHGGWMGNAYYTKRVMQSILSQDDK